MKDITQTRISVTLHTVAAIVMGWLSITLANNLYALGLGVLVLIIVGFLTERITKKKGIKWWFGNGIFIYLFLWLVSWIFFLNL
jgi:hypothetical protein